MRKRAQKRKRIADDVVKEQTQIQENKSSDSELSFEDQSDTESPVSDVEWKPCQQKIPTLSVMSKYNFVNILLE